MKYVSWNDKQVAYEVHGKGKVVVLLHGFCSDSFVWKDFMQDLVEENYKVITIDLPGFGESDLIEEPSIAKMADAVHAVLLELKLSSFVLMGHSMGGYITLNYLEKYPENIAGIGLIHSHPFADSEEKKAAREKGIEFITRIGHPLYVKQLIPTLFTEKAVRSNSFMVDKLIFRASRYKSQGIIDALTAMKNRPDRSDVLRNSKVPVLFIIGEKDQAIPHEYSMEQTHLAETASIHILPKVAHMGMFEAEKPTQLIIRQFADFCFGS